MTTTVKFTHVNGNKAVELVDGNGVVHAVLDAPGGRQRLERRGRARRRRSAEERDLIRRNFRSAGPGLIPRGFLLPECRKFDYSLLGVVVGRNGIKKFGIIGTVTYGKNSNRMDGNSEKSRFL